MNNSKLESVQSFLERYTDENTLECVFDGKMADINRAEVLKLQNVNDTVKIALIEEDEEIIEKVPFKQLEITSDISLWSD